MIRRKGCRWRWDEIAVLLLVVGKEYWSDAAGNAVVAAIDMVLGPNWMVYRHTYPSSSCPSLHIYIYARINLLFLGTHCHPTPICMHACMLICFFITSSVLQPSCKSIDNKSYSFIILRYVLYIYLSSVLW